MGRKILVVDDEAQIARVLRMALESNGYEVTVARDGVDALEKYGKTGPDLVITDLSMPEMDGIELTRTIRQRGQTPIIVLSVKDSEGMKVSALDEGADDYITKPFSIQELLARVRSNLRRSMPAEETQRSVVDAGDFHIDVDQHVVERAGEEIHLTPKEFELLVLFARNPGRVLTHKFLLNAIWGVAGKDQPEYLRVLVAQLRKKIEPAGESKYIRNEPWVGYRFNIETVGEEEQAGTAVPLTDS
jgi:two-component system KDP operon response regulator KdpE